MDLGDPYDGFDSDIGTIRPRVLPPDLPKSLNDRRRTPPLNTETEIYDAWQGGMTSAKPSPYSREFYLPPHPFSPTLYDDDDFYSSFTPPASASSSPGDARPKPRNVMMSNTDGAMLPHFRSTGEPQFITAPVPARLNFNLDPDFRDDDDDVKGIADSDTRLVSMLAAQAAFNDGTGLEDEDEIAENPKLSDREKTEHLQRALNMAASNGDEPKVKRILEGKGKKYVDVNAPDEEGTSPLIYASCFVSSAFYRFRGFTTLWGKGNG